MFSLLLLLAGPAIQTDAPPAVQIQLNHEQFVRGDRARVYVQTAQDGHLVVLHADPDGRVRVLFPLDPTDDDFVRGGDKRHELRGRAGREAFFVDGDDGTGTVLAAVSPDPLSYDGFVRNGHWDYRALGGQAVRDDPLAGLLDIVRRMAGESRFQYDAASYVASGQIASRYGHGWGAGYGWYGARYGLGLGLSFGYPYRFGSFYDPFYDPFCYDPFWRGSAACSRFGFGYSGFYYRRPFVYGRPFLGGFGNRSVGSRYVTPRDRVFVTPVEPRRRVGLVNPGGATRSMQPRARESRGPAIAPRGRGPSAARPARPSGTRGGASARGGGGGGGGGGRRH
jgi:hypothetical protein